MNPAHVPTRDHCAKPGAGTPERPAPGVPDAWPYSSARRAGLRWGIRAALLLAGLYGVTLSLLNGADYAWHTFLALWYWMVPLVAGFSLQVALFGYSRSLARAGVSPHAKGVVVSGSTSALSMVACCTHHLTDVLPLVGLAGALSVPQPPSCSTW
jgi:hypothetical protein